ncbi:MAG: hypothetical protein R2711_10205 [Acidimicrobiales bacterium]
MRPVLDGEREVIEAELRPEGRGERWRQVRAASSGRRRWCSCRT